MVADEEGFQEGPEQGGIRGDGQVVGQAQAEDLGQAETAEHAAQLVMAAGAVARLHLAFAVAGWVIRLTRIMTTTTTRTRRIAFTSSPPSQARSGAEARSAPGGGFCRARSPLHRVACRCR